MTEPPLPLNEAAKSSSNYYQSYDRRFVLKCISKEDVEQIHNILPEYHRVIRSNSSLIIPFLFQYIVETQGDTLLPHYYAMYRLTVDDKENYILVMRNILSSRLKTHYKYDVKVGEKATRMNCGLERMFRGQPWIEMQRIKKKPRLVQH